MVTIDELTETEQDIWRRWLSQYLKYQNHTGRHAYRYMLDPLNPTVRSVVCWKCGKYKP